MIKIALIEPYFTGSHSQWALSLKKFSEHHIEIFSMKGNYWKWRMHGGAITLSKELNRSSFRADVILATDMLDLATFLSLLNKKPRASAIYFHENQLTYPWSPKDRDIKEKRDFHYGFINITSALVANAVYFNSEFHKTSFINAVSKFLKSFPDYNNLDSKDKILFKSQKLQLGLNLKKFDNFNVEKRNDIPVLLWNHRWEYDKNPKDFFDVINMLKKDNIQFKLVLLGERFGNYPEEFKNAINNFKDEILHIGYVKSFDEYAEWLWKSDIIPITSNQEFFGVSCIEAIYCKCIPLLPNRLAFPEHFKNKKFNNYFYESKDHLYVKLKKILCEFRAKKTPDFRKEIIKYDWQKTIKIYDNQFSELLNNV